MNNQNDKSKRPSFPADVGLDDESAGATRRDLFKASAIVAGAAAAGVISGVTSATAETTANGATYKVVDFRCRPPLKPYRKAMSSRRWG
jgi:hypothetical protein